MTISNIKQCTSLGRKCFKFQHLNIVYKKYKSTTTVFTVHRDTKRSLQLYSVYIRILLITVISRYKTYRGNYIIPLLLQKTVFHCSKTIIAR